MFAPSKIKVGARAVALALALATSSFSAHAVLQRVGPVDPSPTGGGFPAWYQDTTGLTLEFCSPTNASEVSGGWCLLLPPITAPESFPTRFFIEHFYFSANASAPPRTGGKFSMIMGLEASFANGANIVPGEQITFARIRVFLTTVPTTGTYRIIHPYGEELLQGVAGQKIFFTDDVGIGCLGDFTCAMQSRMGPWLLPSTTPGGLEMAPLTATNPNPDPTVIPATPYPGTGKPYIADPARVGPITGSALPNFIDSTGASRNHNIFRVEGPAGSGLGINPATGAVVDWVETTNFSLAGRVFTGTMPGAATLDRASYTRNATGMKVDVLATGLPSTAARLPAAVAAPATPPTLTFFNAPCGGTVDPLTGAIKPPFTAPVAALGVVETQMLSTGQQFWGQVRPAVLPTTVCLKNGNARDAFGNLIATYVPANVTDEVTISKAAYDSGLGTLTVAATSSDTTIPPVLNLTYGAFTGPLVAGQIVVPNVAVPPANVGVQSSALGSNKMLVTTSFPAPPAANAPVGTPDSFTFAEDSGPHILSVLANDLNAVGGTITLTSVPAKGTAVVNVGGTVTYTSAVNANGADSFTYTVTVGTLVSAPTTVSLNITPVNDPPVAVNDTATTPINTPLAINVLANDTDPDGVTDLLNAVLVTGPAAGATVTGGAGGIFNFNATATGTYTFTYRAQDRALATSVNAATVTVNVVAPFAIVLNKILYETAKQTLSVSGTTSNPGTPTITFSFLNAAGSVLSVAGTVPAAAGRFVFSAITPLPPGATAVRISSSDGSVLNTAIVFK